MANQPIRFYLTDQPFGEFSNFAAFPFHLDGADWPTSEHYFQARKFVDSEHVQAIRTASTPMRAARMGRDRSRPLRADWEAVKDDVMRAALHAKFTQHASLTALLQSTGDADLIEHTENDHYWGDGGDGTGRNMLGRLLVELRNSLRVLPNDRSAVTEHAG